MSMQQDVLDTIGVEGIDKDQLYAKVGNIAQGELDGIVLQLQRAGRVRLAFGRYEVTGGTRADRPGAIANQHPTPTHSSPPPTAAEEAAANLKPPTRVCARCSAEKELNTKNFSRNRHGFLNICKPCYQLALTAGREGKCIHNGSGGVEADTREQSPSPDRVSEGGRGTTRKSSVLPGQPADDSVKLNDPRGSCAPPAVSIVTPGTTLTGEGSQSPVGEPSRSRELRPDGVLERAQAKRSAALNRITVLEVDVANLRSTVTECDLFLEMYGRFAQEGAG